MGERNRKYTIDTEENREFLKGITENLLSCQEEEHNG